MSFEIKQNNRYACKRYDKEKEVSQENIDKMIKAAHLCPTSCNMQHAHLLICNSDESMNNLVDICMKQGTARTANKAIIVLASKASKSGVNTPRYKEVVTGMTDRLNTILPEEKQVSYDFVSSRTAAFCDKPEDEYINWSKANSYLVAMNIVNQATDLGIDTCLVEGFKKELFEEKYPQFTEDYEIALVITMGYRAEEQPLRDRLDINTLFTNI